MRSGAARSFAPALAYETSRFELKYLVEPWEVPSMRAFMSPFMKPDPFAAGREGNSYDVSSLYLDTDDLLLYRMTAEGRMRRFKLRVRSYPSAHQAPAFLEVKGREDRAVVKKRGPIPRDEVASFLEEALDPRQGGHGLRRRDAREEFAQLVRKLRATPCVAIAYRREAYESRFGVPVRITFDSQLRHRPARPRDRAEAFGWMPTRVNKMILEIKFNSLFPGWVSRFVQRFELERRSIPKYLFALEDTAREGRIPGLTPASLNALTVLHNSWRNH